MFKLEQGINKLEIAINGYESEDHRAYSNSWGNFYANVVTKDISFESNCCGIDSVEIDSLKKMLDDFNENNMKENKCFFIVEEGFSIRFYPKGVEYGNVFENEKLIEKKEAEIFIAIPDNVFLSRESVKFLLNEKEIIEFSKYISDVISNEW